MISFHPFYMLPLCNTARWDTHCGAAYAMIYRFICDAPEDWGFGGGAPIPQSHSAVRAPGANDALMMMYMASKALRDSMLPHQGGWSISEAILTAGQATADNLPAGLAEIQYMIRVPTIAMAEQVTAVLDRNAEAAAQHDRLPLRAPLGVEVAAGPRQPRHGAHRLRGARDGRPAALGRSRQGDRARNPDECRRRADGRPVHPRMRAADLARRRPRRSCAATCRRRSSTRPPTTTPT